MAFLQLGESLCSFCPGLTGLAVYMLYVEGHRFLLMDRCGKREQKLLKHTSGSRVHEVVHTALLLLLQKTSWISFHFIVLQSLQQTGRQTGQPVIFYVLNSFLLFPLFLFTFILYIEPILENNKDMRKCFILHEAKWLKTTFSGATYVHIGSELIHNVYITNLVMQCN